MESANTQSHNEQTISKSKAKKLRRLEHIKANRADKRKQEKARRKENRKKLVAEGRNVPPRKPQTYKMVDSKCKQRVVIDLQFQSTMTDKQLMQLSNQVSHLYGSNRRSINPMQLSLTSTTGEVRQRLDKVGLKGWDIEYTESNLLDEFKNKNELVYLSSESANILETLDDSKVYVIGGMVDYNSLKDHCLNYAKRNGLAHARLPVATNIRLNSRHVLPVNHVYDILLTYTQTSDWALAMKSVIPKRKIAVDDNVSMLTHADHNEKATTTEGSHDSEDTWNKNGDVHSEDCDSQEIVCGHDAEIGNRCSEGMRKRHVQDCVNGSDLDDTIATKYRKVTDSEHSIGMNKPLALTAIGYEENVQEKDRVLDGVVNETEVSTVDISFVAKDKAADDTNATDKLVTKAEEYDSIDYIDNCSDALINDFCSLATNVEVEHCSQAINVDKWDDKANTDGREDAIDLDKCNDKADNDSCEDAIDVDKCDDKVNTDGCEDAIDVDKCDDKVSTDGCEDAIDVYECNDKVNNDCHEDSIFVDKWDDKVNTDCCEDAIDVDKCNDKADNDFYEDAIDVDKCNDKANNDCLENAIDVDRCDDKVNTDGCEDAIDVDKCDDKADNDCYEDTIFVDRCDDKVNTDGCEDAIDVYECNDKANNDCLEDAIFVDRCDDKVNTDGREDAIDLDKCNDKADNDCYEDTIFVDRCDDKVNTDDCEDAIDVDECNDKVNTNCCEGVIDMYKCDDKANTDGHDNAVNVDDRGSDTEDYLSDLANIEDDSSLDGTIILSEGDSDNDGGRHGA